MSTTKKKIKLKASTVHAPGDLLVVYVFMSFGMFSLHSTIFYSNLCQISSSGDIILFGTHILLLPLPWLWLCFEGLL